MGKFFKYEDSNWRTFIINTTGGSDSNGLIKRPKRRVTAADFIGAVIEIDGVQSTVLGVFDDDGDLTITVVGDDSGSPAFVQITYDASDDLFTYGEDNILDNVMIDEFGREEKFI